MHKIYLFRTALFAVIMIAVLSLRANAAGIKPLGIDPADPTGAFQIATDGSSLSGVPGSGSPEMQLAGTVNLNMGNPSAMIAQSVVVGAPGIIDCYRIGVARTITHFDVSHRLAFIIATNTITVTLYQAVFGVITNIAVTSVVSSLFGFGVTSTFPPIVLPAGSCYSFRVQISGTSTAYLGPVSITAY